MNSHRLRAYIYLILTAAIWGAAGPIIKYTLDGIDPLPFLSYRFAIASIFSIIFFGIKIGKGKKFRQLRAHFPLALLYGILAVPVGLGILFFGLDNSTVLDLTLIGVVGPLLITAGGAAFFHDHITKKEKLGIMIVILGVALNSFVPLFRSAGKLALTGNFLLVIFLLADSSSTLMAKRLVQDKIKSANLTNLAFIIGALVFIPITFLGYGFGNFINTIATLPLKYHLGVWYMALISGNLAYFLYIRAQRSIEVSEAVLFHYLQPLFMVPLAVFWLRESITASFLVGGAIIAVGLFIAEIKKKRYNINP